MDARHPQAPAGDRPLTRGPGPSAPELLRAALEKIVFFEWRLSELAAELAGAQSRSASCEQERMKADDARRGAELQCQAARLQLAELEADRARMAALLARPQAHPVVDGAALEAERARAAVLRAELEETRRELDRSKLERSRWMEEMIAQGRAGDDAPAALAQFISELRGEVIALRERQRQSDALLQAEGITPPRPAELESAHPTPQREPDAVEAARKLWAEGRLGGVAAELDQAAAVVAISRHGDQAIPLPVRTELLPGMALAQKQPNSAARTGNSAALALAEQCLKGLTAHDPARRAQAARHLAALPTSAAAPGLAAALGRETDPKARAELARALVACGGDAAAGMVAALIGECEAPLVRLAALEALTSLGGPRAREAVESCASDSVPTLRRRAATLAHTLEGTADLLARLAADPDSRVRAAATADRVAPAAPPTPVLHEDDVPIAPLAAESEAPAPRRRQVDSPAAAALLAVRSSIFGLSETELGTALQLPGEDCAALVASLLEQGRLARRGRRLVAGEAADEPARVERGA